ncbi:uncharacterized protein PAC_13386 [Phialocephala subalpina]|uniref:Uncharacterized protein n=1 Tax=Phialocephala subalpina TaxID=576137 RepID=A0A1L7XEM0_9HELO|nr:uncharacterized protein PAC_13386 [Phialocephala subalpina]
MMSATRYPVALVLLAAQIVTGLPDLVARSASTCGSTIATVAHVTTITIESIVTIAHSCYTHSITTKHHGTGCPDLSTCGVRAECILASIQMVTLPPRDECCPTTPTVAVQGPCPTCQKGCFTNTVTHYVTGDAVLLAKRGGAASTPCTKTVFRSDPMVLGPTKTVHPLIVTSTVSVQCGGCQLLTSNIGGLGPAVSFLATITNTAPATTTTWVCAIKVDVVNVMEMTKQNWK